MNPIDAIVARLILVLGLDSTLAAGTITDDYPEANIATDDLPLAVVNSGDATYEKLNANTYRIRRAFSIEIFYAAVTPAERRNGNALAVVRSLLVDIPNLLANHNRLDYNDSGLLSVVRVEMDADAGPGYAQWRNTTYAGTLLTAFVTYDQNINYGGS